jgi:hypothetical protein
LPSGSAASVASRRDARRQTTEAKLGPTGTVSQSPGGSVVDVVVGSGVVLDEVELLDDGELVLGTTVLLVDDVELLDDVELVVGACVDVEVDDVEVVVGTALVLVDELLDDVELLDEVELLDDVELVVGGCVDVEVVLGAMLVLVDDVELLDDVELVLGASVDVELVVVDGPTKPRTAITWLPTPNVEKRKSPVSGSIVAPSILVRPDRNVRRVANTGSPLASTSNALTLLYPYSHTSTLAAVNCGLASLT